MRCEDIIKKINYTPPTPKPGDIAELEREAKEMLDKHILAANREATR